MPKRAYGRMLAQIPHPNGFNSAYNGSNVAFLRLVADHLHRGYRKRHFPTPLDAHLAPAKTVKAQFQVPTKSSIRRLGPHRARLQHLADAHGSIHTPVRSALGHLSKAAAEACLSIAAAPRISISPIA
ncbi:hypothetical protein QO239_25665 [Cupriavidus taiwanensis]|uniref:hypothetical protein n=1 Tax=Cupriavidus taiwanensis TaxID=164546 RepID=UPI0025416086|nr:hypothetical protein [Cupriavidus taiwanensis]MDK3025993.1 hypothetical protein [Cupriavidus taiwanensis]